MPPHLFRAFVCTSVAITAACSCSSSYHISKIKENALSGELALGEEPLPAPDTLRKAVVAESGDPSVMETFIDDDGSQTLADRLDAAVVTARFRHVSEHNGKVSLAFSITVPEDIQDDRWQLRYQPVLYVGDDSTRLERIFITGAKYRRQQLKGYQQYERYLGRIVTDTTQFVSREQLEVFLKRNLPSVYRYRQDSSFVSDEEFEMAFPVTEHEAVEHFTRTAMIRRNERLLAGREKMFRKYVKSPIISSGLRLDTVMATGGGYVYEYVQDVDIRKRETLRRIDLALDCEVYEEGRQVYSFPRPEELTFYISSISSFADRSTRYVKEISLRRVDVRKTYSIGFERGSAVLDTAFADNARVLGSIREELERLEADGEFALDSVGICASASPEGLSSLNTMLSGGRSNALCSYFRKTSEVGQDLPFIARSKGEDWETLSEVVAGDARLDIFDKEEFFSLCDIKDEDVRESRMQREKWYGYVKDSLYPGLRRVYMEFFLHRRDMVRDTVFTTRPDTTYQNGVLALRDREYEKAYSILREYNDFNTAVACIGTDRNLSALAILDNCKGSAEADYLAAIALARIGREKEALERFDKACAQNASLVHRGNLDPEISELKRKYRYRLY